MATKKYKRMTNREKDERKRCKTEHIYDRFRNDDEFRSIWKCK